MYRGAVPLVVARQEMKLNDLEVTRFQSLELEICSVSVCPSYFMVNTIGTAKKQRENKRVRLIVVTYSIYKRLAATFRAVFPANQIEKRCFPALGSGCRCLLRVIIG